MNRRRVMGTRSMAARLLGAVVVLGTMLGASGSGAAWARPGTPAKPPRGTLECGTTVTKNVKLRADLDCTGRTGTAVITVGADHVHIDLNGFTIRNTRGYTHVINIEGRRKVHVRNGSIEGGTEYALFVKDSADVHLRDLEVRGSGVPASDFGAGIEVEATRKVRLHRVTVRGNNADGMHLHAATDVHIDRSVFRANGGDGLWVNRNTTKLRIDHSEFSGSLVDDGFDAIDAGTIEVRHSTFSGNPGRGIELDRIASLRLSKVTLQSNGGEGLSLDTVTEMRLDRVNAVGNASDGIRIANNTGVLRKNRIQHSTSTGNGGDGFDIQFPVTGKKNQASGNTGTNTAP